MVWEGGLGNPAPLPDLAQQFVILSVAADPEPLNSLWNWHAKRPVMQANANAPIAPITDRLELQGRMRRVLLEQGEIAVGQYLHIGWQCVETCPESA